MGNIIAAIAVLGILGALFGLILAVASKVFEVKKDPREEAILGHLAGANCGGCGYPGCAGCAGRRDPLHPRDAGAALGGDRQRLRRRADLGL